ncbi:MAG: amidohydrolase family protein [Alphaproteobacteria bacterium]
MRPKPTRNVLGVVVLMAGALLLPVASADERLPIFDAHVHYSADAWAVFDAQAVLEKLAKAGVARALVSSSPDDGTLRLYRKDPSRVVPVLRPYHDDIGPGNWFQDARVPPYIEGRLESGVYGGIGEFHLSDAGAASTNEMVRVVRLAVARDIPLHVHSGAGPVCALFALDPRLKILWAHAGMTEPPEVVRRMLDRYPRLWTEVSYRAAEIAPGGRLDPAWRDVLLGHPDRFMIGTDTWIAERWSRYDEIVEEHRRWLAQLPAAVAEAIAFRNAMGLFGAGEVAEFGE